MKDNLEEIKKIPLILEAKRLEITPEIKKRLGIWSKGAIANSKKIFAYKIIYKSKGKKIVGYIVEPREGKNLPCIIWNRGGSRDFGSIRIGELFYDYGTIASLAKRGYIVIATQYPGVAGGDGTDKMGSDDDIASILDLYKILKSYKRADTTKVGMDGFSRGGMMTYMCLANVKWIKASVVGAAPSDEVSATKFRKGWEQHQKKMYGGSIAEKKKRSAIYWVDKFSKKTPLLVMHGTADWRVKPENSMQMAQELYKNKIPFRLILFEGADHGLTEFREEYKRQVFDWFDRFLKKGERLPNLKPHGR